MSYMLSSSGFESVSWGVLDEKVCEQERSVESYER